MNISPGFLSHYGLGPKATTHFSSSPFCSGNHDDTGSQFPRERGKQDMLIRRRHRGRSSASHVTASSREPEAAWRTLRALDANSLWLKYMFGGIDTLISRNQIISCIHIYLNINNNAIVVRKNIQIQYVLICNQACGVNVLQI